MIDSATLQYLTDKGREDMELASACVLAVVEMISAVTSGRMPSPEAFGPMSKFDSPDEAMNNLRKLGTNLHTLSDHLPNHAVNEGPVAPGPVTAEPDLASAEDFSVEVPGTGLIATPEGEHDPSSYPNF